MDSAGYVYVADFANQVIEGYPQACWSGRWRERAFRAQRMALETSLNLVIRIRWLFRLRERYTWDLRENLNCGLFKPSRMLPPAKRRLILILVLLIRRTWHRS